MIGIYKITSPTGKVYIGQSVNIKRRLRAYKTLRCEKQPLLYNSLSKHGFNYHVFEVVYELPRDVSPCVIDEYERFYITQHKEAGCQLLNSTDGGSNGRHSEETKNKLRVQAKGRLHTDESKSKISEALKGRPNSEKAIELLIKRNTGRTVSDSTRLSQRQKMLGKYDDNKNPFFGKSHSLQTKKILSERRKIPIIQSAIDGQIIKEWPSALDAASSLKVSRTSITACCRGQNKSAGGYHWTYK